MAFHFTQLRQQAAPGAKVDGVKVVLDIDRHLADLLIASVHGTDEARVEAAEALNQAFPGCDDSISGGIASAVRLAATAEPETPGATVAHAKLAAKLAATRRLWERASAPATPTPTQTPTPEPAQGKRR